MEYLFTITRDLFFKAPLPLRKAVNNTPYDRFIKRLYLPENINVAIVDTIKNDNDELLKKFKRNITKKSKILELYHVSREDYSHTQCDTSMSIFSHGFTRSNPYGNKGYGTYLANHGRYSLNWTGPDVPVIVCYVVDNDDGKVERYKSEIYSPESSSEYVIKDYSLIYPAYILKYKVEDNYCNEGNKYKCGYVAHGEFDCEKCDTKNEYGYATRCDCKYDTTDLADVIDKDHVEFELKN